MINSSFTDLVHCLWNTAWNWGLVGINDKVKRDEIVKSIRSIQQKKTNHQRGLYETSPIFRWWIPHSVVDKSPHVHHHYSPIILKIYVYWLPSGARIWIFDEKLPRKRNALWNIFFRHVSDPCFRPQYLLQKRRLL